MRHWHWVSLKTGKYGKGFKRPLYSQKVLTRKEWLKYKNDFGLLPPKEVGEQRIEESPHDQEVHGQSIKS